MDPTLKVILMDGPNEIATYGVETLLSTARQEESNLSDTEKQFVSKIKYILDCHDRVATYNSEKQPWLLNNLFMNTITDLGNVLTQETIEIISYSKAISTIGQIIDNLNISNEINESKAEQEIPPKNNLSTKELFGKLLELIQFNRLYEFSNRVDIVNYLTLIQINGLDEIANLRSGRVYVNSDKQSLTSTIKLVIDKVNELLIKEYLFVDYEHNSAAEQASLIEKISLIINELSPLISEETKKINLDEYTGPSAPPIPDLIFTVTNIYEKLTLINSTKNINQEFDIYGFLNESYMLLTIHMNRVKKICQGTFDTLKESSNLLHNYNETDCVKNTSCYNIPKSWILAIKQNNWTTSNYIKQALYEKLIRDGLL